MKEDENKNGRQPSAEEQKELSDIINAATSSVVVRGKVWKVEEMFPGAKRKVSSIIVDSDEDDMKVTCKCSAALYLNGLWKIKFFYWIVWRWFFYIRQYRDSELVPFIEECKKKAGQDAYVIATMSLIAMKDTIMNQTREEVERFRAELLSEQLSRLEKSTRN